jgi:hypothetical protein
MEIAENFDNSQVRTILHFNLFLETPKSFEILKFQKY